MAQRAGDLRFGMLGLGGFGIWKIWRCPTACPLGLSPLRSQAGAGARLAAGWWRLASSEV